MTIIVDTREQLPLWDDCIRQKLDVGDYTTKKLKKKFIIERKSGQDLYGTILQGHKRFKKQIVRADQTGIKMVVYVECTYENFIDKSFSGGRFRYCPGEVLRKIIKTISTRYDLEFIWCDGRAEMKQLILKRFRKEEYKLTKL